MTISGTWLQNVDYAARLDRLTQEGMIGGEGVLGYGSMAVTANGGSLSVDVGTGFAAIAGDDQNNQGVYVAYNDASANVSFSAPGSNSWYVGILLQVQDPNATGPAGDNIILDTVTGASDATPAKPTVPDSALLLEWVLVSSGDTLGTDCTLEGGRSSAPLNPTGIIQPWAGLTSSQVPNGWLLCDGTAVSRTTYKGLFNLFGTTYGSGNGSTTFNLPDLRGRMPIGLDNMGGSSANRVTSGLADQVGGTSGAQTHTLTSAEIASHSHSDGSLATSSNGSHAHTFTGHAAGNEIMDDSGSGGSSRGAIPTQGGWGAGGNEITLVSNGGHTHTISGTTGTSGSGSAHNNMPPYMALHYIIKT